jgi:DNA-binding MarR family transcriptional regulator
MRSTICRKLLDGALNALQLPEEPRELLAGHAVALDEAWRQVAAGLAVDTAARLDDEGRLHAQKVTVVPDPPSLVDLRNRVCATCETIPGPGSRVAEVASTFAAGVGAISKMMDRLEARGWAVRLPHPADRRSSLLSLTPSGTALVAEAERTFHDFLSELISPAIGTGQLHAAAAALAALRQVLERERVGIPVG